MATALLHVDHLENYTNYQGLGPTLEQDNINQNFIPTGDTTYFACLAAILDGKTLVAAVGSGSIDIFFEDEGTIGVGATINSVAFEVRVSAPTPVDITSGFLNYWTGPNFGTDFIAVPYVNGNIGPAATTITTGALATRPGTGLPWTRANLFATAAKASLMNPENSWSSISFGGETGVVVDYMGLVVDYTAAGVSINPSEGASTRDVTVIDLTANYDKTNPPRVFFNNTTERFGVNKLVVVDTHTITFQVPMVAGVERDFDLEINAVVVGTFHVKPEWFKIPELGYFSYGITPGISANLFDFTLRVDEFVEGSFYRSGTKFVWRLLDPPTNPDHGWWLSVRESFAGASVIVNNTRPKNPRGYVEF